MNSGNGFCFADVASSRAGNRSAAPRFDGFAELGGDAGARFARTDSTAFGMRESNAELAIAFPARVRRKAGL